MIAAGTLNKTITIQKLTKFKDRFMQEVEDWQTVFTAKQQVKDYTERDYRQMINDEIIMTDRLTFTCRPYICKYLALDYRIMYKCHPYRILSISDLSDRVVILTELIND